MSKIVFKAGGVDPTKAKPAKKTEKKQEVVEKPSDEATEELSAVASTDEAVQIALFPVSLNKNCLNRVSTCSALSPLLSFGENLSTLVETAFLGCNLPAKSK